MTGWDTTSAAEPYAPSRRTALLLTGTGTAGAYHAGVLRALHEAGVKIDVVAARGVGVVGALFAAIDGAPRLWAEQGFWRAPHLSRLYGWRSSARALGWALTASVLLVSVPLAAMAVGLVVYPFDFLLKMVGVGAGGGMTARYLELVAAAFAPDGLPTWLPRLVLIVLGAGGIVACVEAAAAKGRRRHRGRAWWWALRPPLARRPVEERLWTHLWDLLRGAAALKRPSPADLGRRYAELLAENLGQPVFRELLIAVHDLDARRDLVFAMVEESRRLGLFRRTTSAEALLRRAEVLDLAGLARTHLPDAVAAALAVPLASDPHVIQFAPDAFWRGESHRLCDRPGSVTRLIAELCDLDVAQIVIVSSAPDPQGPHALMAPPIDPIGRLGEYCQSAEAAAMHDVLASATGRPYRLFTIRPGHNPVGPFDFAGGFDDRSDRRQRVSELTSQGYEDAYRQFIEPVVAVSGERVGQAATQGV